MTKTPNLSDVVNISTSAPVINENSRRIEQSFENTISRDGSTPNQMEADLDMNSNDVLNVGTISALDFNVNGQSLGDIVEEARGYRDQTQAIADSVAEVEGKVFVDTFTGDGSQTTFTTSSLIPDEDYTQVYVNGVYQNKSSYSTNGADVVFEDAPPADAIIEVIANPLQTVGQVDASAVTYDGGNVADALDALAEDSTVVRTSRVVGSGDGLTGGGNLSANRTLSVDGTVARRNVENVFTAPQNLARGLSVIAAPGGNSNVWLRNPDSELIAELIASPSARTLTLRTYTSGGALVNARLHPDGVFEAPVFRGNGSQLTALPVVGVGQTWVDVTSSRAINTSYQNTTGRPIQVHVKYDWGEQIMRVSSNGSSWVVLGSGEGMMSVSVVIPAGHYYRMDGTRQDRVLRWAELR